MVITALTALSFSELTISLESYLDSFLTVAIQRLSLAPRILDCCAWIKTSPRHSLMEDSMSSLTNRVMNLILKSSSCFLKVATTIWRALLAPASAFLRDF
jgi:hypothetical protein